MILMFVEFCDRFFILKILPLAPSPFPFYHCIFIAKLFKIIVELKEAKLYVFFLLIFVLISLHCLCEKCDDYIFDIINNKKYWSM